MAVSVFGVGRLGIYRQQFDQNGIGHFALDSYSYQTDAASLAEKLAQGHAIAWLRTTVDFHVKLYSLSFTVFRPLLGETILAAEPLNLLYYLAILVLTFTLAQRVADRQAAMLASAVVALWPSLLLHTTQLLRDPVFIVAVLMLVLMLTNLLTRAYSLGKGMSVGVIGTLAALTLWLVRSEMWLVVRTVVFLALALFVIRIWRERKPLVGNSAGMVLLFVATMATTFTVPPPELAPPPPTRGPDVSVAGGPRQKSVENTKAVENTKDVSLWARIAERRHGFITAGRGQSGSDIDSNVEFSGRADVIRYIPRAAEIGYLAPFPKMWFTSGYNVQLIGRLIAAAETLLLYAIEVLALIGLWQMRQQLDVWLLLLSGAMCITALGLVVVNVGTLYRMRYAFCILLVILAATVVGRWLNLRRLDKTEDLSAI